MTKPTLLFLHALGASAREWDPVLAALPGQDGIALDLPGFGANAALGYHDVDAMVGWVASEMRALGRDSWIVIGHSMGGKIATVLAARAASGDATLPEIAGVVLVAASPPSPEPMEEARRTEMVGWTGQGAISRADAETFVAANIAQSLPPTSQAQAISDVMRTNPAAWRGWLERGAREDRSDTVGAIALPALIVAGAEDGDLDEAAQRRLNLPHYPQASIEVLADAAHLMPYEQSEALADLIRRHIEAVQATDLPKAFAHLLASDRVSSGTRAAMLDRVAPPRQPHQSDWTAEQRIVLTALIQRILPDLPRAGELATRLEASLVEGRGDGWRFAELPSDLDAWALGLRTLQAWAGDFAGLAVAEQDACLVHMAEGPYAPAHTMKGLLSSDQMRLWFEDVRAESVRTWVSLPRTMARIGYDGFAVGGDAPRKQGYVETAADTIEPWQITPGAAS